MTRRSRSTSRRIPLTIGAGLCTFAAVLLVVGPPHNGAASTTNRPQPATTQPTDAAPPTTPPPTATPAPEPVASSVPAPTPVAATTAPDTGGCAAALTYLAAHAKPGTVSYCPHYAEGHPAETWLTLTNGVAATEIYIAIPCPAAYQNEASNSWGHWDTTGTWIGDYPDDPYGTC